MPIQIYLVEKSDRSWALVAAESPYEAIEALGWPQDICKAQWKRNVSGVVIERFIESGIAKSYTSEFLEEEL